MENTNVTTLNSELFEAIRNGKLPTVERLYWKAAKLDKKDKGGNTLLMVALFNCHFSIANWLVEREPSLLIERNAKGDTPLTFCAYMGHLEGVQWLIKKGVDIQEKNSQGKTAYVRAKVLIFTVIVVWLESEGI